jgi:serine/threonine protein kinase
VSPEFGEERYQRSEILHQSANSTLYKAVDILDGREVVIKCFEVEAQGAYLREMAVFSIEHEHITRCLDTFYQRDGKPCMVYEYYRLGSLEKWLDVHGPADLDFCLKCLGDILSGLVHLNNNGRIHCDIKPHNILLRQVGNGPPSFILCDLGSACSLREAKEARHKLGTPAYIAPERLYDRFFANSDLYSLGIVAFELSVGHRPFLGTPEELTRCHLSKPPPLHEVPYPALRDYIGCLLVKNPDRRLADAATAYALLRGITCNRPVTEKPYTKGKEAKQSGNAIVPSILEFKHQLPIEHVPQNILAYHIQGDPVVGLEYNNHIEITYFSTLSRHLIVKTGPVHWLSEQAFCYACINKIYRFNLFTRERECLHDTEEEIIDFRVGHGQIILRNDQGYILSALKSAKQYPIKLKNYFHLPQACIFKNGGLGLCAGYGNQDLIILDDKANIIDTIHFKGPIIELIEDGNGALVLTLEMRGDSQLRLWHVANSTLGKSINIPHKIKKFCHTTGFLWWIDFDNHLFMCGGDLVIRALGKITGGIDLMQFSSDHRWLITLVNEAGTHAIDTFFSVQGESIHAVCSS